MSVMPKCQTNNPIVNVSHLVHWWIYLIKSNANITGKLSHDGSKRVRMIKPGC